MSPVRKPVIHSADEYKTHRENIRRTQVNEFRETVNMVLDRDRVHLSLNKASKSKRSFLYQLQEINAVEAR